MLFGEDQGRYLIACNFDCAEELMTRASRAGVTLSSVGRFTGTDVSFGTSSAPLSDLKAIHAGTFAETFG